MAPRLAAELMGYVSDVSLTLTVWNVMGRTAEALTLRQSAFDGLAGYDPRELAAPGAISEQVSAWRDAPAGDLAIAGV